MGTQTTTNTTSAGRQALVESIEAKARTIRCHIVKMVGLAKSGHPGGSLSAADIVATLYFHELKHRSEDPHWSDRDRFVLSKGHAAPVLYAALAESGYFPVEDLWTLRKIDSHLQGHPDMLKTRGVEISTGSLGMGFSAAVGMALGVKIDKKDSRVYALIGDGESQEGIIWEASMFAAQHKLDNLVGILDYNNMQIDGLVSEIVDIQPAAAKWSAFGWHTIEIDGHSVEQLIDAFEKARSIKGKPTMIIANTVKGKCVSFMEGVVDFHGKAPSADQVDKAICEIEALGPLG
ncbi:MAG: transketolase [Candidatus Aquicultor secundus]|uniref:Transketolase n=1 Tax=Candidatus Aquicultor secundus TaxID=1973895 RepID=A0A2M7T578_9ACTN|nr:transketolase [Candidatus Aquicultor secundus]OIO88683.1 MAG: transketolase [Candidatus Aquicultor secundus]PIU26634.1 MAG: transketolase [Candidatus Aquicultor secundus]PIX53182.1 MAG: transketolase [Candidatus Aquicultor secundus]PIZ35047.1 MAG: transketolase [Candidatus Aquicultor secundus]PJB80860.1 MAG: transketolase [Candidatus Aquicultor secundus]